MRLYGKQWKCMTSPKDHKKILDSLDASSSRSPKQEPSPAQDKARKKNLIPGYKKKKQQGEGKK